jgi:hypothetical protein
MKHRHEVVRVQNLMVVPVCAVVAASRAYVAYALRQRLSRLTAQPETSVKRLSSDSMVGK